MNISVIGLGKLGLPLVASIASKGFFTYGVDIDKEVVKNLNKGLTYLKEPDLQNLIKKFNKNICALEDVKKATLNSDITFIITPTPSKKTGYFSTLFVENAAREIARSLKEKNKYHLVVLVSTVMPGSTEKLKKIIEKQSGKVCGLDFGLCYNPEFIALGSVIFNLLNPDFVLIGESDKKAGELLEKFYKKFCINNPKIVKMNFVNAELTKISVNTFVTTKISYANMLSEICEKLPGGNVDEVTAALGLDSRIGIKYLKGGAAFGGPCFPRDNVAFISLAKKLNTFYKLSQATHQTNLYQINRLANRIFKLIKSGKTVGILGLAYKPYTDVIDESVGLLLSKLLLSKNVSLILHDPFAIENTKKVLKDKPKYTYNLKKCIQESDLLVIATNWPEYQAVKPNWFGNKPKIIIDPWRIFKHENFKKNITYIPLGINF